MLTKTALLAIVTLLLNSGGLLLCQWECLTGELTRHAATSCHKSQDDSPAFQTASNHDCVATSTAPATTSAKSVESAKHRFAPMPSRVPMTAVAAAALLQIPSPPGSPRLAPSLLTVVLRV